MSSFGVIGQPEESVILSRKILLTLKLIIMDKKLHFFIVLTLLFSCSIFIQAQTFVGSEACKLCHDNAQWDFIYSEWEDSGHPYKFNVIQNDQPPEYPNYVENYQDQWMENLGDGTHDWTQIAGVIGGYGWKARFVGNDGHIVGTAGSAYSNGFGHNQFNFFGGENHGWVDYHPADEKIYNYGCFKCHTTGGTLEGTWLDGVDGLGNFTEGGIGCESCHGPGSEHVAGPTKDNIDMVYEFAHADNSSGGLTIGEDLILPNPDGDDVNFLCGTCHNRDYASPINAKGGFIKHHEQWDEFVVTDHFEHSMNCNTCHDPHKRVIWEGDGITMNCGTCHPNQVATTNHSPGATCVDCHMPYAAKSGTTRGESGFVGDVRSHLFKITVDEESMFTEDGSWVRDDETREASLSPAYSCLGCHNNDSDDGIPEKTLAEAVAAAVDMHDPSFISQYNDEIEMSIYPNPTNGATNISVALNKAEDVNIKIFNASGQLVYSIADINKPAGNHLFYWDGTNSGVSVNAGYYFVKVTAGTQTTVKKLVLMK